MNDYYNWYLIKNSIMKLIIMEIISNWRIYDVGICGM